MDYKLSRRGFLGGALAAIPVVGLVVRLRRIVEAEYVIESTVSHGPPHRFDIVTYTDGSIEAAINGAAMRAKGPGDSWVEFISNEALAARGEFAEMRLRRVSRTELEVDWLVYCKAKDDLRLSPPEFLPPFTCRTGGSPAYDMEWF